MLSVQSSYYFTHLYFSFAVVVTPHDCNGCKEIKQIVLKQTTMLSEMEKKIAMLLEAIQSVAAQVQMKEFHAIVLDENVELPVLPIDKIESLNGLDIRLMSSSVVDQMVIMFGATLILFILICNIFFVIF